MKNDNDRFAFTQSGRSNAKARRARRSDAKEHQKSLASKAESSRFASIESGIERSHRVSPTSHSSHPAFALFAPSRLRIRSGFTLIELIAALLIVALLAATFVPYALSIREKSARVHCIANLKSIWGAMANYAAANKYFYPRTRFDPAMGNGWTAFTGADDQNPFADSSTVKPNDVSASLWLLVREGLAKPEWFVCPSSWGEADRMLDVYGTPTVAKQRGNFRSSLNLTYCYATPFSSIEEYRLNDTLPARFALLADQGPSIEQLNNKPPAYTSTPAQLAAINSVNHRVAGQNILFADGSISFETSPYCGVGGSRNVADGDNIYTALSYSVLVNEQPKHNEPGVAGVGIGPAYRYDTYLVPPAAFKSE